MCDMHACMHTYTYIHTYMYTYIHTYIHVYIHVHAFQVLNEDPSWHVEDPPSLLGKFLCYAIESIPEVVVQVHMCVLARVHAFMHVHIHSCIPARVYRQAV